MTRAMERVDAADVENSVTENAQTAAWKGDFGREYSDRNTFDVDMLNSLYLKNYGVTRSHINEKILRHVPNDSSFLEVGCNTGNQLLLLQQMGYANLAGVELQPYALELARARTRNISLRQGSALGLPYEDAAFDVVFTSGVLIHISPADLSHAMEEIHRCTRSYIWGLEYYSAQPTEVNYRGREGMLWKMDYVGSYLERFDDLELVEELRIPYLQNANVDTVFLLKKRGGVSAEIL